MEHESDDDIICNWRNRYSNQSIDTGTGGFRNKGTSGDHLNYAIAETIQDTERSLGNLRRLAII